MRRDLLYERGILLYAQSRKTRLRRVAKEGMDGMKMIKTRKGALLLIFFSPILSWIVSFLYDLVGFADTMLPWLLTDISIKIIGEKKKSEAKHPFAFLSSSFLSHPSHFTGNVLCSIVLYFFAVFALSLSPEYPKEAPVATS